MPDTNFYDYLIPLLETDEGLYDPEAFMSEYGMYLTPYDTSAEELASQQEHLVGQTLQEQVYGDVQNVQKGLAATGLSGSYMGTRANEALIQAAGKMSAVNIQALEQRKKLQRAYNRQLYAQLGELANLDAFTEGGVGMENILTGSEAEVWYAQEDLYESPFIDPCPCPNGGQSVSCCSYQELAEAGFYDDPPPEYGDVDYDYGGLGSQELGVDEWSSGFLSLIHI